jgi:hypothetical protein
LVEKGMDPKDISTTPETEKREIFKALCNSMAAPPPSFEPSSPSFSDDAAVLKKAPALSLSELQASSQLYISSQPIHPAHIDLTRMRSLVNDEAAAANNGQDTVASLFEFWSSLVSELAVYTNFERSRYSSAIQNAAKELERPPPRNGIKIDLLLPTGNRISRSFALSAAARDVYIWCAADERMVKDTIKPGFFVIITAHGYPIDPKVPVGEQIQEKRVLLNVRVLL